MKVKLIFAGIFAAMALAVSACSGFGGYYAPSHHSLIVHHVVHHVTVIHHVTRYRSVVRHSYFHSYRHH